MSAAHASGGNTYAFFDVDDTIITIKSMFEFFKYWCSVEHNLPKLLSSFKETFSESRMRGISREELNRTYYRYFKDVNLDDLTQAGTKWFAKTEAENASLYHDPVIAALKMHLADGVAPVFVSGSCHPLLDPLAARLNVEHILCAPLEITAANILTGELGEPQTIGVGKQQALRVFLDNRDAEASACFAYGDDISDLPMLESVGNPVVVGACGPLIEIANARGWRKLTVPCYPQKAA